MRSFVPTALAFAVIVASAGRTDAQASYASVVVGHAGRIEGMVRWSGVAPTLAPLPVPAGAFAASCGSDTPAPTLRIDAATRGVADTVLALTDINAGAAPVASTTVLDQRRCVFTPHVIVTTVGSSLRFENHDTGVLHNVHAYRGLVGSDTAFNIASLSGMSLTRTLDEPGLFRIVCDAGHPWMLGYVHVFRHPYATVTGTDGRFAIVNVPPGRYHLHVWHEGWRAGGLDGAQRTIWSSPVETDRVVTVRPDGVVSTDFVMDDAPAIR